MANKQTLNMKIGFYSPYLTAHAGGGEKHFLATAALVSGLHEATIFVPEKTNVDTLKKSFEEQFDLDLSKLKWDKSGVFLTGKAWQRWQTSRQFDAFWLVTDGSFFLNGSKKGIVHIQVPFTNKLSLSNRLKLKSWPIINANAQFTKRVIEDHWNIRVTHLHAPYVDLEKFAEIPTRRQKAILNLGRFTSPSNTLHRKRQDVLVEAFILGCQKYKWDKNGWELNLVGPVDGDAEESVRQLKNKAKPWPINIITDANHNQVLNLLKNSDLYWHGAGYEINEAIEPGKVEHFGMSILEAAAAGAVPVVVLKGGISEILGHDYPWEFSTITELVERSRELMSQSLPERAALRHELQHKAHRYSLDAFAASIAIQLGCAI